MENEDILIVQSEKVKSCIQKIEPLEERLVNFLSKNEFIQIQSREFMAAYDSVQVLNTKGSRTEKSEMFKWYSQKVKIYIKEYYVTAFDGLHEEDFLEAIIQQWDSYKLYIYWMFMVLKTFDQGYKNTYNKSVQGESFMNLRNEVFFAVKGKLNKIIFDYLALEREHNKVPKEKIIKIILFMVALGYGNDVELEIGKSSNGFIALNYINGNKTHGIDKDAPYYQYYDKYFKTYLLANTREYYKQKVLVWTQQRSHEYVQHALNSIQKEMEISKIYFKWSQKDYIEVLDQELILEVMELVAKQPASGIKIMLQDDKINELEDIFKLYKRKSDQTYKVIAMELKQYIQETGLQFNQDVKLMKDPLEYIRTVIEFKIRIDKIVRETLDNILLFQNARDEAFKHFLNQFEKAPRFLSMYSDNELRSKMKGQSEEEVDKRMQDILNIFLYLYQKDSYIEDYSRFLSKRLLNQSSISDDWETKMISKLKAEAGQTGVQKLLHMCQDIRTSKEKITGEFKEYVSKQNEFSGIECNITVLTKSIWPLKTDPENDPFQPEEFKPYISLFEKYYESIYKKGRTLEFLISQGQSEMNAYFPQNRKILQVTNFQVSILLQFNKCIGGTITYKNIKEYTRISSSDLKENLLALIKLKILNRESSQALDELKDNERISFNEDFTDKKVKIKCIPGKELRKKVGGGEQSAQQNEQDKKFQEDLKIQRQNILDAKIVMIMKANRSYSLNQITADCMTLITLFKPEIKDIKLRVENLIERDYLKRNPDDKTKYEYLP